MRPRQRLVAVLPGDCDGFNCPLLHPTAPWMGWTRWWPRHYALEEVGRTRQVCYESPGDPRWPEGVAALFVLALRCASARLIDARGTAGSDKGLWTNQVHSELGT